MLSIPGAIALAFWFKWWVGLIALLIVPAALFKATRKAACQFVMDYAVKDEQFFQFVRDRSVLEIGGTSPSVQMAVGSPVQASPPDMSFEKAEKVTDQFRGLWDGQEDRTFIPVSQLPASIEEVKYAVFLTTLGRMNEGKDAETVLTKFATIYGRLSGVVADDKLKSIALQGEDPAAAMQSMAELGEEIDDERRELQNEFVLKMNEFFRLAEEQNSRPSRAGADGTDGLGA